MNAANALRESGKAVYSGRTLLIGRVRACSSGGNYLRITYEQKSLNPNEFRQFAKMAYRCPCLRVLLSKPRKRLPQRIGYARVSTLDQDPEHQIKALEEAGCDAIYADRGLRCPPVAPAVGKSP